MRFNIIPIFFIIKYNPRILYCNFTFFFQNYIFNFRIITNYFRIIISLITIFFAYNFLLADDMGWGDVRCHGNDKIDTPYVDRLAAEMGELERF